MVFDIYEIMKALYCVWSRYFGQPFDDLNNVGVQVTLLNIQSVFDTSHRYSYIKLYIRLQFHQIPREVVYRSYRK